jgi:hypothetical protein
MPRYYFHVEDHHTDIDEVGTELPDLEAARSEAVRAAGEILRDGAAKISHASRELSGACLTPCI